MIPPVIKDKLVKICGRIGDSKAQGLESILHETLYLVVKLRWNMFTELFKAGKSEEIFPAAWKRPKLVLLPKAGKSSDQTFS